MKQGTGAITNPTNGTTYTASANWSSKGTQLGSSGYYCIYNNNGNSVTVTNTTANTQYTVQAFEYNSSGSSSVFNISTATGNPNNATSLPVELTSFTGVALGNTVNLNWATATEVNNYGFEIERSAVSNQSSAESRKLNSDSWKLIAFVQGHGNSNSSKSYSFEDKNPPAGKVQYRLKQIDFDGAFEYSPVVEVIIDAPVATELKQNFPNPFNPETTISYALPERTDVLLTIFDPLGREITTLVNEIQESGIHNIKFNGETLNSGIYFYRLKAGNFSEVKKLLLVK